jgi:hypothetical protein
MNMGILGSLVLSTMLIGVPPVIAAESVAIVAGTSYRVAGAGIPTGETLDARCCRRR